MRLPQSNPRRRNLCLVLNAPFFPQVVGRPNTLRRIGLVKLSARLHSYLCSHTYEIPVKIKKRKKALLSPIHFSYLKGRMRTNYVASTPRIQVLYTSLVRSFVGTTRNNELAKWICLSSGKNELEMYQNRSANRELRVSCQLPSCLLP